MSTSLPTFSLLNHQEDISPCLTFGDEVFYLAPKDNFNKWFFSKIGYLIFNDCKNIIVDKILFLVLGGSGTWLSLLSKKITINKFRTDNAVYEDFIKAVSTKFLLCKGFNPEHSDKLSSIKMPDDFEQVLLFYYNKYLDNPYEKIFYSSILSPEEAIKNSMNHNGLYTMVKVDNNIYSRGNTLFFNQRLQAENSLLLVFFFAELFENKDICEKIRSCVESKEISSDKQKEIETFINEMDE